MVLGRAEALRYRTVGYQAMGGRPAKAGHDVLFHYAICSERLVAVAVARSRAQAADTGRLTAREA